MPAGGTWTAQNKRRPGAYINFASVPKPTGITGDRGIITAAFPMTWGPTDRLISLLNEELTNGKSQAKVGCTISDISASLPFRLALSGCSKALLFRTDMGGVKATGVLLADSLTAVAKYTGTTGNTITVAIVADKPTAGLHEVQVYVDSKLKEAFTVSAMADFSDIESEWADFVVAGTPASTVIPALAGVTLQGGTNGTVSTASYTPYLALVDTEIWQCMAVESVDAAVPPLIAAKIATLRQNRGKKVQAVVYDYNTADTEGIISVKQGFKTPDDTVTLALFPIWVASITAGSAINVSNTARVIPEAYEITNPIAEDAIADQLALGHFVLSYRQDGAVCVEQDINSLHTFTPDKDVAFSKNRVIRCLDSISNNTSLIFARNYLGKIDNNAIGRNTYKAEMISFFDKLQEAGAIQNFGGSSDITILPGEELEAVVVDLAIQPVDSMEKLYMTVNVNA